MLKIPATESSAIKLKSNTQAFPVADSVKAQAVITWLGAGSGVSAKVRLYDRLFSDLSPDAGGKAT